MITTSTPKGTEGINISYSDEQKYGVRLQKVLPEDWKVHFDWYQILFTDVQYKIDKKKKTIFVAYNQNLHIWWSELVSEIETKLQKMKVKTKAPTPVNA